MKVLIITLLYVLANGCPVKRDVSFSFSQDMSFEIKKKEGEKQDNVIGNANVTTGEKQDNVIGNANVTTIKGNITGEKQKNSKKVKVSKKCMCKK
jgi:hypothetical protein